MIVVTGAAGFIGSVLVGELNRRGFKDVVAVDDFSNAVKNKNLENKHLTSKVHRDKFFQWLDENHRFVQFIFHLGARTDTTEFNKAIFDKLNVNYSKKVWNKSVEYGLPLIYASSAATYGMGEHGYKDSHDIIEKLRPLNPYGESKNEFDKWVITQKEQPFFWAGLKFFNVFGPNEYHKGRMASVVFHAYNQISETGKMKLFRSHHPDFKDGEQKRDFIYVKDVADICIFLMEQRQQSGIYNVGTGKACTFIDLANAVFHSLHLNPEIDFIDTPEDIRDKYQYFTQAEMSKLRNTGYTKKFYTLEDSVDDYIQNYLKIKFFY